VLGKSAVYVEIEGTYQGMGAPGDPGKPDYKMLGVVLESEGNAIFAKMVGPKSLIDNETKNFEAFCASLQVVAGGGTTALQPPGPDPSQFSWAAPETWKRGPEKPMRVVTFTAGPNGEAECYISVLSGAAGGETANINRWRQQMSQDPLTQEQVDQLPTIKVMGQDAKLVEITGDFTGMAGATQSGFMLLGVVCPRAADSVFVKMTGPGAAMQAEKENFTKFCESLKSE
ncbi:MAG: hypothetical protein HY706_02820, partial [Candidatus Hydrogenedentes bacterium]|nr:hypothetical protein [Candidatus Hydrogenedentota bacterium]